MSVYSFLDVQAALSGPGGSVNLASGAGVMKEGITFEPADTLNNMVTGADGQVIHNLHATRAGRATVRLQKTSPTNSMLMAMQLLQRTSSLFHGQNILTLSNPVTGDNYTCQEVAFAKVPTNTWAEDASVLEWNFDIGRMDPLLGAG